MPCGNGATVTQRKHGVCGPSFYFFCGLLLVALCRSESWSLGSQTAAGRGCSPCPVNCSCAPAGPQQSCAVNCSNVGLERAPGAAEMPPLTTVLDLSRNQISSLDTSLLNRLPGLRELYLQGNRIVILPRGVFCCGPLSILDLSNNQITKIEERICDNLCNLTQIDLSSNPFECDCKLFHLVNWLQEKGVRVHRPDAMLCNQPPELRHQPLLNVRVLTCGLNYAACLEDSSSGGGGPSELVIFSSSTPGNFTREQCNSICFAASHRYGGLGARQQCLCSTNSEPNFISESQCSAACTNPSVMKECGWTLAQDVFAVDFSISLKPLLLQSIHNSISFSVVSSVMPVTLSWEFGDLSPRVNTSATEVTTAMHKYGLPGQYGVNVIAWAGHKEVSACGEVTVAFPPKLELHCPLLSVVNGSLEITLVSWGSLDLSVDWQITKDDVQVTKASPHCPKDGVYHIESSCCFEIVLGEMSWTDAHQQCLERGGDLAIVRGDTLRNLLAHKVTQERGVWLGLSDVTSPGTLRWVNGSEAQNGEEGPPPRFPISHGNVCVSLDQRAQTSLHPCNTQRAFVCQYSSQVKVPDAGIYMIGLPVFPSHNSLLQAPVAPFPTAQTPSIGIELMLFPALSFVQPGRLSSLEFVTRELSAHVHIRLQIYRPHCYYPGLRLILPGCHGPLCAPVAICVPDSTRNVDPPVCSRLQQWCPFQHRCLDLSSPCQLSSCPNCTKAHHLPHGALRPQYTLQDEVAFTLPAGPAANVLIQDQLEDLLVFAGDVIGLQHDSGPASLLRCQPSPTSPWRQPVLALNHSEWILINTSRESADSSSGHRVDPRPHLDLESLLEAGEACWLEEVVCPIRVLYVGHSEIPLQGAPLSAGLSQPGLYTLLVSSAQPSYPASASCPLEVVPPLDLTILHPALLNGSLYLQPNNTRVLLHVQSRYTTRASQRGTNSSVTFQPDCPSVFASRPALCKPRSSSGTKVTEQSLYAVLDLSLVAEEQKGQIQVELRAYNNLTESVLTVLLQFEEPLRGLVVQPYPAHRVLMESVVSYAASVLEGSNPTFKWTVDDKPYFTYYNSVLNVIYQNAAVYKLTVTAMNHISSLTEHFNVTVDQLQPMTNFTVRGVPDVVPQGSAQTLTASVVVDMSVSATFRWSFGDGGYQEFEFKPPYAPSLFHPDSPKQVLLSNNITYSYSQPGIYIALVSVSNRYENISLSINMSVYSVLTHVDIQTEPQLLLSGKSADFEAHPLPSPYGIHYEWNFGDDSAQCQGRRVAHTYMHSGAFNACVSVNNTISYTRACADMFVFEEIEELRAESSSPSELHTPTIVKAHLASGNNITWTFSMGDGNNYTTSEPHVSHSYPRDGNYTVNVTATNAVSSGWTLVTVQVYVYQVIRIEPSGCVQERTPVYFDTLSSGNVSASLYEWSFGDGSPNETYLGNPRVSHTYNASGNYHLSLHLSSGINKASKAYYFKLVCVEPALTSINFTLEKTHYAVGEDIRLQVRPEPQYTYSYQWNLGTDEEPLLTYGSGNVLTRYKNPGHYIVTVTVFNNISTSNGSVLVQVQMPVGPIVILHNATEYNYLILREPYLFTTSVSSPDVTHTWNFGDGDLFKGHSVPYTYNISGNYNITLTAANSVSRNRSILPVAVLSPIRGLTINASLINVPLNASVDFEAQIVEGDDVRFSWILCDHCTSIPGTHTMFYTFRSVGTFNIIVTAENYIGKAQASIFLFVQRELQGLHILPEEEMGGGGDTGVDGCCFATNRVLHLHAGLKEGTNMTFTWNIINELDPISSRFNISGKTVEVNFSTPGRCIIILRAVNLLGQLSVNRTIHFVDPAGGVDLQISKNPVGVNAHTNLSVATLEGSDLQYRWFVNGDILEWKEPWKTHMFSSPGVYLVNVEVFNEVSLKLVSERVIVEEVISELGFTAIDATEQNYIATGVPVELHGQVVKGTDVTWTWTLDGTTKTGQNTSVVFQEPKTAIITLNATNDISEQMVSKEFFVQDKIQGLELRASKKIAVVGERVEFTISMAAGTDVNLILSISGDATVTPQLNQTYVHAFTRVDTYMVNLTAHNQVSFKRRHLQVEVMEPIRGLSMQGSCTAIPVGVKRLFTASIVTGKPVQFLWTFDLHHLHKTSHFGKEQVAYIPEEAGLLTIYLRAFNALHAQNITKHILVQNLLMDAVLYATPQDTLVNKTVTLMTSVTPRSNPLECFWDFNDGSTPIHTNTLTVGHEFKNPGSYMVQVNCSNLVSWVLAQVNVNISVLECEEPEVQVIQAPRLAIWRSQPTFVEATVDLKGCVLYGAQYLWQVLTTPSCDGDHLLPPGVLAHLSQPFPNTEIPLPMEVDVRRLQLSLPKMTLATGNYTLVFSLSYEGVPLRKAACLQLSVMAARLMPIIEGGTFRVWSRTQDLQLSAEQSYDPNMDSESQSLLHYHWDCQTTSKGPEHCSSLNFGLGSNGPVLGISGSELEAGVKYTFKLSISKDGMTPESTTQTVLVQSGHIPMVYLECVSCRAQSIYEVSQNSYVYLRGTCTNCQGFHRGRWTAMTLQNETLILDSSSTTTENDCMNLVLRQGVLRHGDSYIFTLHVTDDTLDGEGAASITLHHNMPPAGGECHLRAGGEAGGENGDAEGGWTIRTLLDRVHFNCSGYSDRGVSETPLLYSLLVTRCKEDYCEEFCVYKGSSPEHSAFLPPGFSSARHRVAVSITVEDLQGATITALNKSVEVLLPDPPAVYSSLPHWLAELTDSRLKQLLEQGDSQTVRELSLALITVLNEYEQSRESTRVSQVERVYRVRVRSNITRALTALDLNTVNDIQQTSAALAQCTAVSREFICEECQNSTLNKLESMLEILQNDTKQGTVTPTEIADNILNIMGDLIHQVSQAASYFQPAYVDSATVFSTSPLPSSGAIHGGILLDPSPSSLEPHPLRVAAKAYSLSSVLMLILMHGRVLNEEPLVLRGSEIAATGKLADPQSLLCYHGNSSPECQRFSIPRAFNSSLGKAAAGNSVMQLLLQLESNPFPFNYVANYTVSTEVASMEFRTENGTQIPISGLDDSLAITVAINNGTGAELGTDSSGAAGVPTAGAVNISRCDSVIVRVITGNNNRQAGLFVQLNFTSLEDAGRTPESSEDSEEPYIEAYLHSHERPNEFNCTDRKRITLNMTRSQGLDHRKYTFFLSPQTYDTTLDYFINVTAPCNPTSTSAGIHLEVGLFVSLCQYFSESEKQWRTDGMVPLAETNASRAVCRTRHLTAFAAGLFVPPHAISFTAPARSGPPSLVVLMVCVLGLLSYVVAAAILHKLDQLDLRRAGVVPLCGTDGLFKYEVQVKTGWSLGAGTTAHVGISLYGREGRTGHRHLDSRGAFTRNALDIFHIATDTSLGSVWKMRIWHDNKGLSPAWMLQYVLVKDLQTGSSYYFQVDEWLSVDNEKTEGRVEMEVEASEDGSLRQFPRILRAELQRALCESHLWLSLWEKPPRSPFTRLQRATCCALLVQLFLAFNTLWYSIVVDKRVSPQAVGQSSSLNGKTVAAGVVTCLIAYPLYLLVFTLFRMSRSKCVSVEQVPPPGDQESVEIDYFLDNSLAGSSFLYFDGETNSEETNVDLPTPSTKSLESWGMADEETDDRDWPELLGRVSVTGGAGHGAGLPRLKRGQGSRHLGVDMTFNPDDEDEQRHKYFTSSDEDLIKYILRDGQNLFPQADESEMADLASIFDDNTEVILLQKINDPLPLESVRREPPKTAFSSNTVVADVCRPRRFPPWCGRAALWGSWAAIGLANSVSIWAAHGFNQKVAMMWLISCFASFLCSCLLLEPIKVLCEALYYAVFVCRLRPEDQDVLVEFPTVARVVQRVHRVRPPQGYALSQDRHQARKVRLLHTMLKNFLVYMFFLLVVLLLNYSDSAKDAHSLRLQTQLRHVLHTPEYHNISSRHDVWTWLNASLLPRLLNNSALLGDTGSVLLGTLRLRQIHHRQVLDGSRARDMWGPAAPASVWRLDQRSGLSNATDLVLQLNRSLEGASNSLQQLQQQHWLGDRSRALFVEFSLYNINTNLLAVFSFLFEFPVSERAQSTLDLIVITLWPITGLDLQLLLMMVLLALVLYFLVRGFLGFLREGYSYLLSAWRVLGVCKLALAASVCGLHLSRCVMAQQQWASYLSRPRDAFTDFYPLAKQSQMYTVMAALLLFILVLKASHQLRFLREWALFGRALRHSARELLGVALALLLLLLAYSHTGHLLFHSVFEGYASVSSASLSFLGAGGRGLMSWEPSRTLTGPATSVSSLVFHASFAVLRLILVWLVTSILLRNYRRGRAELYRPAVDLQDYEMVELFLRRLKMWMGFSKTKEFRHKVRFEGMELPPSRSSSTSDCKSLCLPPLDRPDSPSTPDSIDAGSEASWCPATSSRCSLTEAPGVGMGLGHGLGPNVAVGGTSLRERAENEASLKRLLPTFDALLQQLDRVTMVTEDLFHLECRLERAQRKRRHRAKVKGVDQGQRGKRGDKNCRRKERKSGKDKHKGGKRAKKKDTSELRTECQDSAANLKMTPATSKALPPSSPPASPSKSFISAPPPTPVTEPSTPPRSHSQPPKSSTGAPCTTAATPPSPSSPPPTAWEHPPAEREALPSSSLFNHPAHTTTIPTHKRKRKPPPLKNKVHPN
ncbi:polycystin-1 isoform X1 [Syngnathoides biaculeatus]|uniref:polycystin-1 isoform X1 n=1 Tax=Syngnathoides biaculeatus TaxID=300417 RepID=UPI002ADD7DC6|nr:polycystin-1 isoform X1 [Syngnathoides biaculeatus]